LIPSKVCPAFLSFPWAFFLFPRFPRSVVTSLVESYLERVRQATRDCYSDTVLEVALSVYEKARHDPEAAFTAFVALPQSTYVPRPWSTQERLTFEALLKKLGTRFHLFRAQLRMSTSEIVNFYYLWKKTQAHDDYLRYRYLILRESGRESHQFLQMTAPLSTRRLRLTTAPSQEKGGLIKPAQFLPSSPSPSNPTPRIESVHRPEKSSGEGKSPFFVNFPFFSRLSLPPFWISHQMRELQDP